MSRRSVGPWWGVVVLLALASCGSDGPSCAPGTKRVGGACVADLEADACGPGTALDGGTCVLSDAGGAADTSGRGGDTGDEDGSGLDGTDATGGDAKGSDATALPCSPSCTAAETCVAGVCEPLPVPETWTCTPESFADGATCHCACGGVDPDCADPKAPVEGCASGQCAPDGTCVACTPSCAGKTCGDDGCGGSCGTCAIGQVCETGGCVACKPACDGKSCGDDGCGGSCGSCAKGQVCNVGQCTSPPADASCFGYCGKVTPSGCACTGDCATQGNCCVNAHVCGCLPTCAGKQCGDDGCGGSCGTCAAGAVCAGGTCAVATCSPQTCNGRGTCQPATGTCACKAPYAPPFCDSCLPGFVNFPSCVTACTSDAGCSDGEPCTKDVCSTTGGCTHLPLAATCTDGDPCTTGDACVGGTCKAKGPTDCDDGNACTTDACAPKTGCSHLPSAATSCDDGDPCTTGDTCAGATCKGGGPTSCDDGNVCTSDSCTKAQGCVNLPSGATCTDGDKCSAGSACQGSTCTSLGAKSCDDGKPCTIDACDAKTGACSHAPATKGSVCEDGNPCTSGDTCDAKGACKPGGTVCALSVAQGLVAHYSAAFASTFDLDQDGGITRWRDLGPGKRHLDVVDSTARPVRVAKAIHGWPGVRLAGAKGLTTQSLAGGEAVSVFAVVCADQGKPLGAIAAHGAAGKGWALAQLPGAATAVHVLTAGADSGMSAKLGASDCAVVAARGAKAGRDLSLSLTTTAEQSAAGAALSKVNAPLRVGAAGAGAVLGELLVYDRALTDTERAAVVTYLRTAWGFAAPTPDVAWFDAADLASVVTGTDGRVTSWKDKSAQQRDAKAVGKGATWVASGTSNGRPALRFDGSDVRLVTGAFAGAPQLTVIAAFELDKPAAKARVMGQAGAWALRRVGAATGGHTIAWLVGGASTGPALPTKSGAWHVWTAVQMAKERSLSQQGGASQSTAGAPAKATTAALTLGNTEAGGQSLGGFIAEVQIFGSALHPLDRAYIVGRMRTKFGL